MYIYIHVHIIQIYINCLITIEVTFLCLSGNAITGIKTELQNNWLNYQITSVLNHKCAAHGWFSLLFAIVV